jgi:hypothetical protein
MGAPGRFDLRLRGIRRLLCAAVAAPLIAAPAAQAGVITPEPHQTPNRRTADPRRNKR